MNAAEVETDSRRLARRAGQDLEWVRTSFWRPAWELRAGEAVLVGLASSSWWGTALNATLDGERVVLGRSPWRDSAARERDGVEVARLRRTCLRRDEDSERLGMSLWWGAGRLDYAGGERAWMKRTPWKSRWTLLDDRGHELATVTRACAGFTTRGVLRLAPRAAERRSLALLVAFSWWIVTREIARQSRAGG